MNLITRLEQYRAEERRLGWQGSFKDYFDMVLERPQLARLSHARVYDMITSLGCETKPNGDTTYNFFSEELFGIEKPLQQLVDYFASAASRLEVRKRILLLMGPVGGGKSSIVTLLKRGLEAYTRSEAGAVYAIQGCPMHEEPLHLIRDELRPEVEREYGLYIEGDLCPACRVMLRDRYESRAEDVMVERVVFSEKNRLGIGTFSPSDPKSQDIAELTGSIDLATIGAYGAESDPRAYRFDGELNVANRGLMEFIEMLKADEKFLYNLLTLSQEQNIKTGRFAMIYADEVIVSHTNEHEFNAFIANKRSEALHDRIILINVPYNLRVSDEVKIYEKLIRQGNLPGVHIAPNTLRDGLDQHPGLDRERREQLLNLIAEARREYDELAKKEVQKAFVYSFEESAKTLLNNYLDNVEAFCNKSKLRDPITEDEVEPDEQLMRAIEEQIGVAETAKKGFREEILIRLSALARRSQTFTYTSHDRLREGIEKKLFADLRDIVKITTSTKTPDEDQLRRINDVVNRLISEQGYCHVCANELLKYVGTLLNR